MAHRVVLMPGDTVGPEVAEHVIRILEAAGVEIAWERVETGEAAVARGNDPLPAAAVEAVRRIGVALKGRIGTPVGGGYASPNVALRKALELYASVRPVRNLRGIACRYPDVNLVVIRENTEDMYAGIEHEVVPGVVESLKVVTAAACTRIVRFAFDYAQKHGRREVALVHKANILKRSDGLFIECARGVAKGYPDIAYRELIVDNACLQLVRNPHQFDVLVMGNLYGDIVSDLCAGLVGGIGVVPGINIGDDCAVFEAVHGHAPHLVGRDLANPLTLLLPAVHLLRHLDEGSAADRVLGAVGDVLEAGKALTPDLGGSATTTAMRDAIIAALGA